MKIKQAAFTFILFISSYTIFAQQSADEIINDYFTALGGRDKIAQMNSINMEGTFEVMNTTSPTNVTILNGKGSKTVTNFNGQEIVQVITENGGWMINPFMGSPDPAPLTQDQYVVMKDRILIGGQLLNYKTNGDNVQFTGTENVGDKPAYKIEATSPDSVKTIYYIDSATHYLSQVSVTYKDQTTTAQFSDFKKTDFGNVMPYGEVLSLPQGMQATITLTKIEVNKPVDPTIFDMPKK